MSKRKSSIDIDKLREESREEENPQGDKNLPQPVPEVPMQISQEVQGNERLLIELDKLNSDYLGLVQFMYKHHTDSNGDPQITLLDLITEYFSLNMLICYNVFKSTGHTDSGKFSTGNTNQGSKFDS